ncbi:hypothetical protein [Streptomyces triticirhizae]|uniref:Uncharacterized protein n=1 Tax=Streptomyces triticirhizae TaxID=2483353 RepID=A0A3M2LT46_9ACTN|nr:hypothetical protein [Streptomyces triticirhizae]RMI39753.1 hypothetical protein EBN88_14275 [Streptomyces triticirhizae]
MAQKPTFRASHTTVIDQRPVGARRSISIREARAEISRARRCRTATVQVHETTDRDGKAMHIAHVMFEPGTWDDTPQVTDIFEIPTEAFTTL